MVRTDDDRLTFTRTMYAVRDAYLSGTDNESDARTVDVLSRNAVREYGRDAHSATLFYLRKIAEKTNDGRIVGLSAMCDDARTRDTRYYAHVAFARILDDIRSLATDGNAERVNGFVRDAENAFASGRFYDCIASLVGLWNAGIVADDDGRIIDAWDAVYARLHNVSRRASRYASRRDVRVPVRLLRAYEIVGRDDTEGFSEGFEYVDDVARWYGILPRSFPQRGIVVLRERDDDDDA